MQLELNGQARIIATGGFASLFREKRLFEEVLPDLVLRGLLQANEMNRD